MQKYREGSGQAKKQILGVQHWSKMHTYRQTDRQTDKHYFIINLQIPPAAHFAHIHQRHAMEE